MFVTYKSYVDEKKMYLRKRNPLAFAIVLLFYKGNTWHNGQTHHVPVFESHADLKEKWKIYDVFSFYITISFYHS